jgi:AAA family ATP:ADP antiporter
VPPTARTRPPSRLFAALTAIERHELPATVTAFLLFFCVLGGYFAVRPVRETVGTLLGADRVADLWMANWIVSIALVPAYGLAVSRLRRRVFLPWTYASVAAALAVVAVILGRGDASVRAGQFFYVFISVLNLFLISVFWSFLAELFGSGQARRLFPVIAAGGTAGALLGPLFTDLTVRAIGNDGVLFLGAGLFGIAVICQRVLLWLWTSGRTADPADPPAAADARDRAIGGNPFAGFWLVLRSPYLLLIASFVALLAAASTFLYFEQLRLVELAFPDPADRTRVFARLDWIVQSLTIVSQLFITGRIAARRGLGVLLSMVPIATIVGFLTLAAWNTFLVLSVVYVGRRFGEYAFVRPGREMLWTPLDKETKYKAKNLVDVPVYRGSDALVAQMQQAIGSAGFGPQTIALLGAAVSAVWALNGWSLGRRHDRGTAPDRSPRPIAGSPATGYRPPATG